jgi:hypothetical protein
VKFVVNESGMAELLTGRQGPVVHWVTDTCRQGVNIAETEAPVDTGYLRAHHQFTVDVEGQEVVGTFGTSAEYGEVVHEGSTTTVAHKGKKATIRRHGNPWLERTLHRLGLVLKRGA